MQALAVSKEGRDPKAYMPWHEQPTRPFSDFKKAYPFMFKSGKGKS